MPSVYLEAITTPKSDVSAESVGEITDAACDGGF